MPRIFDNIDADLLPALRETIAISQHADFCVGYFNLRGWKCIDELVEKWNGGEGQQCRLLVGMQRLPQDELRTAYSFLQPEDQSGNQALIRAKRNLAVQFREQLTNGAPTDADEAGLRRLSSQLKSKKVIVKLYIPGSLHAKLYLCFRSDPNNPITGFLGSSNLTFSGLSRQGELNVDVLDHDATLKLERWFNDRWSDRNCVDITQQLLQVIDESWAGTVSLSPYQIYVKMAYHLAKEARDGLSDFTIPKEMRGSLLEFQSAAVRIAAGHLEKRGGVILGDVVGLGKTVMATALAKVFQEPPHSLETLILCPKNLVGMWEDYAARFRLYAKVVSVTQSQGAWSDMPRYRVVILDESHNLRNREGRRWAVIRDYISRNASKCILLSATPYNKDYLDLANQLRLFLDPEDVVGIRPEEYLRKDCQGQPDEFTKRHQCPLNSLSAFEKSSYPDDWRELMRLFMVRRTRSFVERNYAYTECQNCKTIVKATESNCSRCHRVKTVSDRRFLILEDGERFHFPKRIPKTLKFRIRDKDPDDQYAKLYSDKVVDIIQMLHLPRYGLAKYLKPTINIKTTADEDEITKNLSRAGKRLIGFCRTNLFKRLESSGYAFLLSIRRHILRNFVYLHALAEGLPLPVGKQDSSIFDTGRDDQDNDTFDDDNDTKHDPTEVTAQSMTDFAQAGTHGYNLLKNEHGKNFAWLRQELFVGDLAKHLREDAQRLFQILEIADRWRPDKDEKLIELKKLITKKHDDKKILVFSQFADTVGYLGEQLKADGVKNYGVVTGDIENPAEITRRFSPVSNQARDKVTATEELRVLVATDVLSEGQNLQDSAIVVNYDLPWAIIRLIQRAGRVDRIGQKSEEIFCYSFLPADGVEQLIRLRSRVRQRLKENAEVVGTDENFFEDDKHDSLLHDLFTEKSGIFDDHEDNEVDLSSLAYQIWKNACDIDPSLKNGIPGLADVVLSTKSFSAISRKLLDSSGIGAEAGVMVYVKTADGNDALAWVDEKGNTVTESQHEILRAASCEPSTPALQRLTHHHSLVQRAVTGIQKEHSIVGGQLGRPSSARRRVYERLKDYASEVKDGSFAVKLLHQAIDAIYSAPLTEHARDLLNREMRTGIDNQKLADCVVSLYEEDRLCIPMDEVEAREPKIICSLGIRRE